jgi:periplasmic divalent cation tolerance protein
MKMNILLLTCADKKEAEKISQSLFKKKLIACAKKMPVSSSFLWKGKIDSENEVLLVMESMEAKFKEIEKEVRKLHSYETFVLVSLPVNQVSTGVTEWIKEGLK